MELTFEKFTSSTRCATNMVLLPAQVRSTAEPSFFNLTVTHERWGGSSGIGISSRVSGRAGKRAGGRAGYRWRHAFDGGIFRVGKTKGFIKPLALGWPEGWVAGG